MLIDSINGKNKIKIDSSDIDKLKIQHKACNGWWNWEFNKANRLLPCFIPAQT